MAANAIIPQFGAIDQGGERLTVFLGPQLSGMGDAFWYARLVEDGEGSIPGRCEVVINNNIGQVDETANQVAWNPDNIAGQIKRGMDARAYREFKTWDQDGNQVSSYELLFAGKIDDTQETRDRGVDQMIAIASDARTELRKIRVVGRVICSVSGGSLYFQAGWPAHFNPGGRPNCIFDSQGNPWFAPWPDAGAPGYADPPNDTSTSIGENPPPASAKDVNQACYWTLGTIMVYLKNVYGPTVFTSLSSQFGYFPFLARCPSWVLWPDTFASSLDNEIQANFDAGIGQGTQSQGSSRKGPDVNVNGLYLCGEPGKEGVFDVIFAKSGGWTWNIRYGLDDPNGSTTGTPYAVFNTLQAVPNRYYSSQKAIDIPFAAGGAAATTLNAAIVTAGVVRKGSQNTITRSVGMGGLIKFESRVDTGTNNGLLTAWQSQRFNNSNAAGGSFMTDWIRFDGDETAFYEACKLYPEVLAELMLDPNFNFLSGEFLGRPRAAITRPIWPHLLSYAGNTTGPLDSITEPYPIVVEVDTVGDGTGWTPATEFSVQDIRDNGIIRVGALRDLPVAQDPKKVGIWRFALGKSFPITAATDIVVNPVRMTVAIPADERLVYALRTAADQLGFTQAQLSAAVPYFDTTSDCPDSDELDQSFSRTSFLDLHTLYERWVQNGSWPIPQSVPGSTVQNNATLRDDKLLLQSHVRRDLKQRFRLDRDGTDLRLDGTFVTSYPPGTMLGRLLPIGASSQTPYNLRGIVSRRRFCSDVAVDSNGKPTFHNYTSILVR